MQLLNWTISGRRHGQQGMMPRLSVQCQRLHGILTKESFRLRNAHREEAYISGAKMRARVCLPPLHQQAPPPLRHQGLQMVLQQLPFRHLPLRHPKCGEAVCCEFLDSPSRRHSYRCDNSWSMRCQLNFATSSLETRRPFYA